MKIIVASKPSFVLGDMVDSYSMYMSNMHEALVNSSKAARMWLCKAGNYNIEQSEIASLIEDAIWVSESLLTNFAEYIIRSKRVNGDTDEQKEVFWVAKENGDMQEVTKETYEQMQLDNGGKE